MLKYDFITRKSLVEFAGAGATVPLTGFGYNLAKGVKEAVTDMYNGIIAEQSVESIFEKIALIIENKKLFEEIKENCVVFKYETSKKNYAIRCWFQELKGIKERTQR